MAAAKTSGTAREALQRRDDAGVGLRRGRPGVEASAMESPGPRVILNAGVGACPGAAVATEKIAQHSRTQVSDRDAANRGGVLSAEGLGRRDRGLRSREPSTDSFSPAAKGLSPDLSPPGRHANAAMGLQAPVAAAR
jgi:hypothetical protein